MKQIDDRLRQKMDAHQPGDDIDNKISLADDFPFFFSVPGRDDGTDDTDDIGFVTLDKRNNQGQGIDHG